MPYILSSRREKLDAAISNLAKCLLENTDHANRAGDLNYTITTLLLSVYTTHSGMKYVDHNELMGVLTCVLQEFYRRQTAPYEDVKIKANGDVSKVPIE